MPSARSQSTTNGSKPKPRINNQKSRNWPASKSSCVTTKTVPIAEHSRNSRSFSDSKHFVCSTCQKCIFNANHDSCVTKFLNEVNLRAKVPSNKTTKRYIPVEQTSFAKKPERQIPKRHRSSIKKTSVVHEKTMTPRSCLRWKPTGKIFKTVGLSSELGIHDHSNEQSSSKLVPKVVPLADKTATSRQELELLFHHHITMLRNQSYDPTRTGEIYPRGNPYVRIAVLRSYALSWKPCQGDSLNLPDHRIHKDGDGDASFQLESDSLPHAHAQTTKTYYKHQDSRIMKAQE
ncbi:hypothetical protein Tco_0017463 [Tanacetum coccineum]